MATMDIFEGDAFTVVELTRALENIPYKPALLSGSALFSPRGVRSRTVVIESRDGTLSLIPFSERGSAYRARFPTAARCAPSSAASSRSRTCSWVRGDPRQRMQGSGGPLQAPNEIQPVRDFGSESATQQVQTEVALSAPEAPPGRRDDLRVPPPERHPGAGEGSEGPRDGR